MAHPPVRRQRADGAGERGPRGFHGRRRVPGQTLEQAQRFDVSSGFPCERGLRCTQGAPESRTEAPEGGEASGGKAPLGEAGPAAVQTGRPQARGFPWGGAQVLSQPSVRRGSKAPCAGPRACPEPPPPSPVPRSWTAGFVTHVKSVSSGARPLRALLVLAFLTALLRINSHCWESFR